MRGGEGGGRGGIGSKMGIGRSRAEVRWNEQKNCSKFGDRNCASKEATPGSMAWISMRSTYSMSLYCTYLLLCLSRDY